jgi:hypothetical protein
MLMQTSANLLWKQTRQRITQEQYVHLVSVAKGPIHLVVVALGVLIFVSTFFSSLFSSARDFAVFFR